MSQPDPADAALKARLKATWEAGDFGRLAKLIAVHGEAFMARRGPLRGLRVLDVACGTGNLAIPAAKAGADVTGIDIATNLIEQARARAVAADLHVRFEEGDAEQLPYADGEFDLVVTMYGAMFAPHPERTAAELLRVCRPGGTIAMANWTPSGFTGRMFKLATEFVPPPPGLPPPTLWGDEETVRQRLSSGVAKLQLTKIRLPMALPMPVPGVVEFFKTYFGPTQRAFAALPEARQAEYRNALEALWSNENRARDGTTDVETEYLEVVAVRA